MCTARCWSVLTCLRVAACFRVLRWHACVLRHMSCLWCSRPFSSSFRRVNSLFHSVHVFGVHLADLSARWNSLIRHVAGVRSQEKQPISQASKQIWAESLNNTAAHQPPSFLSLQALACPRHCGRTSTQDSGQTASSHTLTYTYTRLLLQRSWGMRAGQCTYRLE